MNTPSTSQADTEPTENFLRLLGFQMRSPSFGGGGRIISLPTPTELESVTEQELADARQYFNEHLLQTIQ
ncbi:MAG: hypothetical protein K9M03_04375 [Kiritimatiellales bacterium]|nr:hypothetical protein [Kiritimatiellales bacterium]